jgi:L-amino acid N-acyltransferase YncA
LLGVVFEPEPVVRELREADWPAVVAVYGEGIRTGNATFETAAPGWAEWDAGHLVASRLVAELEGEVVGWAALVPYSSRSCYAGVAEDSVYVAERARRRGIGRLLLSELVAQADRAGFWTLQAGIFPENEASLWLHEACGFRRVGIRRRIGQLDGVWRDVVLLERRA